jgi:hypothetical protein
MDGNVYLVGALALPAYSFCRLGGLRFDALLSAALRAEPGGELIFDCFFGDNGVVTHLVPA